MTRPICAAKKDDRTSSHAFPSAHATPWSGPPRLSLFSGDLQVAAGPIRPLPPSAVPVHQPPVSRCRARARQPFAPPPSWSHSPPIRSSASQRFNFFSLTIPLQLAPLTALSLARHCSLCDRDSLRLRPPPRPPHCDLRLATATATSNCAPYLQLVPTRRRLFRLTPSPGGLRASPRWPCTAHLRLHSARLRVATPRRARTPELHLARRAT